MTAGIDTVLIVHVAREWKIFHRRHMLLALAEVLPPQVAMLCVNRPITPDVTLWKDPPRFWRRAGTFEDGRVRVVTPRLLLHDITAGRIPGAPAANTALLRRKVRACLRSYYPSARRVIQWVYHPLQRWVYGAFPEAERVYECYDEYTRTPDGALVASSWRDEQALVRLVDLTFVTSQALLESRRSLTRRLIRTPNGVPEFFFDMVPDSSDQLVQIPSPRIVYVGNARPPLDFSLLEEVFRHRPGWQLIFAGPVDRSVRIPGLRSLPNVHFLPERSFQSVPPLLRQMDAGLIPFQINEFSRALNPLKLAEYLACGLPVVASQLPELSTLGELVFTAPNEPEPFEAAIARALAVDRPSHSRRAIAVARELSWTTIARRYVLPELESAFHL